MFNLTIFKQNDQLIAILNFQGNLDQSTYLELINKTQTLYDSGYRNLVFDMDSIPSVGLSGAFALYSAATLFNGDTPLDPAGGLRALHAMADKVLSQPVRHFKLLRPQPAVKKALSQSGLPVYEDMESALTSFGRDRQYFLPNQSRAARFH